MLLEISELGSQQQALLEKRKVYSESIFSMTRRLSAWL
jgi:hypothetical protein